MTTTDLLILGGGCAGLALAGRLARTSDGPSVLLVEPREEYTEDRTWCFWAVPDARFARLVSHTWDFVSVGSPDRTARVECVERPYSMIRSLDFYRDSIAGIAEAPESRICLGVRAGESRRLPDGRWETETAVGTIRSSAVVDTRPRSFVGAEQPTLWQSFVGAEVEFESAVFDPSCARLMHFQAGAAPVEFVYTLPLSQTRALVELTVLDPAVRSAHALRSRLDRVLTDLGGSVTGKIHRREAGAIPMGLPSRVTGLGPGHAYAGVTSGSARPSTGYAFTRIQSWAEACARSLVIGGPPLAPLRDSPATRFMDATFLRVLERRPELAPEIFLRLFERVSPERLVRFLGDRSTALDRLPIVAALPKLPFLAGCLPSSPPARIPDAKRPVLGR